MARLTTRVTVPLVAVLVLAVLASLVSLLVVVHMTAVAKQIVAENVSSVRAAEELEIALLEQRGLVSAHILDRGNPSWLAELARRETNLSYWLGQARESAHTAKERSLLDQLEVVYHQYDQVRSRVVALYAEGSANAAVSLLLHDMSEAYEQAYGLCEQFIAANEELIAERLAASHAHLRRYLLAVAAYAAATLTLSLALLWVLYRRILLPLRQMAHDADVFGHRVPGGLASEQPPDELRAVGDHLQRLMSDVTEIRSDLVRSQDRLANAEKLASVGKLAASVAHEIRNPLTSLKMRLFSLRQELDSDPQWDDDLRVVSEEIGRLESVVRHFLEFARPPALRLEPCAVTHLVEKSLELCRHRFVEKDIELVCTHEPDLPTVNADPEQIKQVFVNLLFNAADAVTRRGRVWVASQYRDAVDGSAMVQVCFRDDGPGVAPENRGRIFEPFFSTKDTGTGLGLCIAASILERHGGRLELWQPEGEGATFAVSLPVAQQG